MGSHGEDFGENVPEFRTITNNGVAEYYRYISDGRSGESSVTLYVDLYFTNNGLTDGKIYSTSYTFNGSENVFSEKTIYLNQ